MLAGEISSLSQTLKTGILVPAQPTSIEVVSIGCIITLEDPEGTQIQYEVVGYGESDMNTTPKRLEYLAPIIYPFMDCELHEEFPIRMGKKTTTLTLVGIRRVECSS
jgi:transcription elongation GreA/GreB family factor